MIKNKDELETTELRKDALAIVEAAFESVVPHKAIRNRVRLEQEILHVNGSIYDLASYNRIHMVGFGKSSALMALEMEHILGDRISDGLVISTKETPLNHIKFVKGTHPFPSQQNLSATKKIVKFVQQAEPDDLIICLVSGGGSALLFYPTVPFDEYTQKIKQVFNSGADIFELNRIRKKLSKVKDGKLAQMTRTKIVSLVFSDVIGDDLGTIASGPTYSDQGFSHVDNHLLLTNKVALTAMEKKATALGYAPLILTDRLSGEARKAAAILLGKCAKTNSCCLFAGETTVTVSGNGIGGRNQEFCLGAVEHIQGDKECVIISVGTDGLDGPGHNAAGAIICNQTFKASQQKGLNCKTFLKNNDSYQFFRSLNDLIITDVTGSNVADVGVILKKSG